ncbi:ATP-binding protein [Rhodoferax sp.]|uniref:ATP-binding protein n=1 Tax=Rhodoferax sp. TaxID=50421 RepID=UPI00272FED00|nr:ATP-binding protein [Rhodoferax sp.]MDP1531359.1 ATP-binding protein [Rhodoferax sp.]MDP1944822.1 ATP-binding protein [Rhodoferax sp.]MDP2443726.1 ATP-binding protein [Rhodoferax sp.]MDZ4208422.1 ATP-binding protein [Rhodoferax sp.]
MKMLRLRRSLRVRLLLGTLFWIAASILVAGWGLGSLFRQHVSDQFHAELTSQLDQLSAQFTLDAQGRPQLTLALGDPRLSRPYSGYYWQIDQMADSVSARPAAVGQLRSRSLWDHVLALPADILNDGATHQHRAMGPQGQVLGVVERSVRIEDSPDGQARSFRLMTAANEQLMLAPVARLNGLLWLALGVLAAGLMLAAVVQVRVGLAPLRALQSALAKVRQAETQQLEGAFPAEITPLIDDFNKVLAHNADVVARARNHAGNLAHALKTPLSVLANAADAAQEQSPASAKLAQLVSDQVAIARQQVNYHLSRAQVAASTRLPGAKTAVPPVVDGLVRAMCHIHAERQLTLNAGPFAPALGFRGEAQDLQEMLGNLIDNACKWAAQRVDIQARRHADTLVITVDDDGPGLAADQHDRVMQRGVRADEQVPGSGLGLAIVDDLSRLYGGQVTLADSPLGGLRAVLELPALV